MILLPILVFLGLYKNSDFVLFVIDSDKVTESDQIISAGFLSLSTFVMFWTFAVYYYRKVKRNCAGAITTRTYEVLFLNDDGMNFSYHQNNSIHDRSLLVQEIRYEDISKILINKFHNRIQLFGKIKETYYYDFAIKKPAYVDKGEDKEQSIRIYLYYDNSEDFVNELIQRSKVEPVVINEPEE
jgi:hypothetical protein